jgi:hypothetical protein
MGEAAEVGVGVLLAEPRKVKAEPWETVGVKAEAREVPEAKAEVERGVPLTITPPSDKRRLDAWVTGNGRKGICPKAIARMRRGAAGFLAWNSATFSGALLTFSEYSQVLCSTP